MISEMERLMESVQSCVLATAGADGTPHTSLMAYMYDPAQRGLVMMSPTDTLKCRNMDANPRVSVLVDTRARAAGETVQALTISGIFTGFLDPDEENRVRARFLARHPRLEGLAGHENARFFSVRIQTLQLLNGPEDSSFVDLEADCGA